MPSFSHPVDINVNVTEANKKLKVLKDKEGMSV